MQKSCGTARAAAAHIESLDLQKILVKGKNIMSETTSTPNMTRRTFAMGMGAMAAAGIAMSAPVVKFANADEVEDEDAEATEEETDPAMIFELEDPSEYWGENVVTPHTTLESAYENVVEELADEPMSNLVDMVNDTLPLDEIEDAILPDGTVIPAVYVKLRNHLNRIGQGIGSTPIETSYEMIMYLWSEEDAEHEIEMPINTLFDANDYHYLSGRTVEECQEILDDLADRGLIMRANRAGHLVYHLLPYINGFWEFNELREYFENGGDADGVEDAPEAYAAAGAFDSLGIGGAESGESFEALVPLFHTYPISVDVVEEDELAPYMDWRAIIEANEKITVSPCQCRLMWKSLGLDLCDGSGDHPFETCLSFGELAEYFDEIGIGRYITQDEAIEMVEGCVDAGMVPESLSMKDVDIMCMCHGDCCGNLSGYKALGGQAHANVNINSYLLKYDRDACIQCGACIERCPMEAISFDDDGYCFHNNACVRCGQCVSVCPASARILTYRGDYPELGREYVDAVEMLAAERMRRGMITDFAGGEVQASE